MLNEKSRASEQKEVPRQPGDQVANAKFHCGLETAKLIIHLLLHSKTPPTRSGSVLLFLHFGCGAVTPGMFLSQNPLSTTHTVTSGSSLKVRAAQRCQLMCGLRGGEVDGWDEGRRRGGLCAVKSVWGFCIQHRLSGLLLAD